jgi:hypothetical protein
MNVNMNDLGILDKDHHARIIQDVTGVCETANIQVRYLTTSMVPYCTADDVLWVKNFWHRKQRPAGWPGIVYIGVPSAPTRFNAICGALLRNYLDARVLPFNILLDSYENGAVLNPHVLLMPNAYLTASGKAIPSYRSQLLLEILMTRAAQDRPSILYVESLVGLRTVYGAPFADLLTTYDTLYS